jgi:hypothetical protein
VKAFLFPVKQSSAFCIALDGKNRRIAGEQMNPRLFHRKMKFRLCIESQRQSGFRSRNEPQLKTNLL